MPAPGDQERKPDAREIGDGEPRDGEHAQPTPDRGLRTAHEQQGAERHCGKPCDGVPPDATFDGAEGAEAKEQEAGKEIAAQRDGSRPTQQQGRSGKAEAAKDDDTRAPEVADEKVKAGVNDAEESSEQPEAGNQARPAIRLAIALETARHAIFHGGFPDRRQAGKRRPPAHEPSRGIRAIGGNGSRIQLSRRQSRPDATVRLRETGTHASIVPCIVQEICRGRP